MNYRIVQSEEILELFSFRILPSCRFQRKQDQTGITRIDFFLCVFYRRFFFFYRQANYSET